MEVRAEPSERMTMVGFKLRERERQLLLDLAAAEQTTQVAIVRRALDHYEQTAPPPPPVEQRVCAHCGTAFTPTAPHQRFCATPCRHRARWASARTP
jgi:hypothetical protein